MSIDYIVASLPSLTFGAPAPISWEKFCAQAGEVDLTCFEDLSGQLRNALALARGGAKYVRPVKGCALYWQNRMTACFQEKNPLKREALIDRVWWDAAGELTPPANPLGAGALATYAIRLKIALKHDQISSEAGNAAFDRFTAKTKISFEENT